MACPAGGVSVVLGTNFAGKTALCRLVAGLHGPATGRVTLDGEPLDDLSPGDRPVALVVQDFVNYPHWTVAQNIASPMRAVGRSAESCEERVVELAAQEVGVAALVVALIDAHVWAHREADFVRQIAIVLDVLSIFCPMETRVIVRVPFLFGLIVGLGRE